MKEERSSSIKTEVLSVDIEELSAKEGWLIEEIVSIHLAAFQGFFLTFMGRGFLRQMYRSYCDHSASAILAAVRNGRAVGFVAYSEDLSGLYRFMLKKRLVPFAWYSLCAFIRKPNIFFRLMRAFLKPREARHTEQYVKLASIGICPEMQMMGIGSQLISALKSHIDSTQYAYISLETDSDDNDAANKFYRKNGFVPVREYTTREGRKMTEYRHWIKSELHDVIEEDICESSSL